MQEQHVEFYLFKCQGLARRGEYQWQLTDEQAQPAKQLIIAYDGEDDVVQVQDDRGAVLSYIDLCRGAYFTVVRFAWENKTYRYQ